MVEYRTLVAVGTGTEDVRCRSGGRVGLRWWFMVPIQQASRAEILARENNSSQSVVRAAPGTGDGGESRALELAGGSGHLMPSCLPYPYRLFASASLCTCKMVTIQMPLSPHSTLMTSIYHSAL